MIQELQRIATLCNRAVFDATAENLQLAIDKRKAVGDASEVALIRFVEPINSIEEVSF